MKLARVTLFGLGYVFGARAGRERYAQIAEGVAKASHRLEEFSARRPPGRPERGSGRHEGRS